MKKSFIKKSLLCFNLVALIPSAHADLLMSHYETLRNSSESEKLNIYVKGITEGILYTHVQSLYQKNQQHFAH
jgi:hypothetical protein